MTGPEQHTRSGRLQAWLHGGYPPTGNGDPFPGAWRLGNLVSTIRYWAWRARGGKW